MSKIKDTFNKLKNTIIGTVTNKIDDSLDKAVKDISVYRSNESRNNYIELLRSLVSKYNDTDFIQNTFSVSSSIGQTPSILGHSERLMRYKTFDAIVSNITYCYRALCVLVDNILSPDDIKKNCLEITPTSFLEDQVETQSKTELVKEICRRLKIEQNVDKIVLNTLKYGDFFCEIGDTKSALLSRAYLVEHMNPNEDLDIIDLKVDDNKIKIKIDYSSLTEDQSNKGKISINDMKLMFHDPRFVIKLQSEMFPICFGYLIFSKYTLNPQLQMTDQAVNNVCINILKSIQRKIPEIKEIENDKELRDVISTIIKSSDFSKNLNIRFVPENRIQHFKIESTKYFPYGESVFDSVQFLAKVLVALETALTIHRLSRSTEKRKISFELGLPRDARKVIESIKEQFRKRKISLDSFGTVDTIPSMVTTFEDIYVPQKDGRSFIDISTFNEGGVDVRSKVDELRFIRDSIVAALGVPPPFIGIEEQASLRTTISQENVLFARTIVKYQKNLSDQLAELIKKIVSITNPEEALTLLDNVSISFPSPKTLHFEMNAKRMTDVISLIDNLERIGVPREYSKKIFLPDINWDEVERYEIQQKIEKNLGTEQEPTEMGSTLPLPSTSIGYGV